MTYYKGSVYFADNLFFSQKIKYLLVELHKQPTS